MLVLCSVCRLCCGCESALNLLPMTKIYQFPLVNNKKCIYIFFFSTQKCISHYMYKIPFRIFISHNLIQKIYPIPYQLLKTDVATDLVIWQKKSSVKLKSESRQCPVPYMTFYTKRDRLLVWLSVKDWSIQFLRLSHLM